MTKIITNSGIEIDCLNVICPKTYPIMVIYKKIEDDTISSLAMIFESPEETKKIVYIDDENNKYVYKNYTDFVGIESTKEYSGNYDYRIKLLYKEPSEEEPEETNPFSEELLDILLGNTENPVNSESSIEEE